MSKRLTTKQLKNKLDGIAVAIGFGLMFKRDINDLLKLHDKTEKEFISRRNYRQYLPKDGKKE